VRQRLGRDGYDADGGGRWQGDRDARRHGRRTRSLGRLNGRASLRSVDQPLNLRVNLGLLLWVSDRHA
jgi:hypothetical protein